MVGLRQLDYFINIAEVASLSRAAVQLEMSPSILSRTIQDLEMELGSRLFHRTGRGMKLTEFGRQLLPRAQQVMLEADKFSDEAMALQGRLGGSVSIGLPGSIAALIAGQLFEAVHQQYPDIFIRFVEVLSSEVDELLASGRIDIGLFYTDKANSSRGDVPLTDTRFYLVAHAGDELTAAGSVTLSQVARCPLVLPSRPNAVRNMIEEACARQNRDVYILCEVNSLSALKEVVAMGTGYTVSTYDAVAQEVAGGRLNAVPITNPELSRLLVMTLGPKNSLTMAARIIAGAISQISARFISEGRWNVIVSNGMPRSNGGMGT